MNDNKEVCRMLRLHREKLGLTQADISELTGLKQPYICAVERGKISPSIDTVARIAEACNAEIVIVNKKQTK